MKIRHAAATLAAAALLISGCSTTETESEASEDTTVTTTEETSDETSTEESTDEATTDAETSAPAEGSVDDTFATSNLEAAVTLGTTAVTNLDGNEKVDEDAYATLEEKLAAAEGIDAAATSEEKMTAATELRDAIDAVNQSIIDAELANLEPKITEAEEALAAAEGADEELVAALEAQIEAAKELVDMGGQSEYAVQQMISKLDEAVAALG